MGHSLQASVVFLTVLLLSAGASPSPIRPSDWVIHFNGITITGKICCTSTGNCGGQDKEIGAGSVTIELKCTDIFGKTTTVGQGTTNSGGAFNITVPHLIELVLAKPTVPCSARLKLPLLYCPALSTATGSLSSPVKFLGTVVSEAWGKLLHGTISEFKHEN